MPNHFFLFWQRRRVKFFCICNVFSNLLDVGWGHFSREQKSKDKRIKKYRRFPDFLLCCYAKWNCFLKKKHKRVTIPFYPQNIYMNNFGLQCVRKKHTKFYVYKTILKIIYLTESEVNSMRWNSLFNQNMFYSVFLRTHCIHRLITDFIYPN